MNVLKFLGWSITILLVLYFGSAVIAGVWNAIKEEMGNDK